ncbi:MAG TPA: efflux RND transporter periplasmic adaptor subunit [Gemmatimonadaceae bacterium]|jgi:cobalt-zinc-cadmium efflux system membrane fusion protein
MIRQHLFRVAAAAAVVTAIMAGCARDNASGSDAGGEVTATSSGALVLPAAQRERLTVKAVENVAYRPMVRVTGTVAFDGDLSTPVLATISGPVTRVLVQPGTRVARGAPLAYVSSPDFAAAVAAYRKAAATARNLQRIADLDQKLFENDALARRDLEQAQTDAVSANADRDAALEQLRALGVEDHTLQELEANHPVANVQGVIRAPIAGTVVERLVSPGQLLQAGSTMCFTIADLSRMWVLADVFETDLPDVRLGDPADVVTTASPRTFRGTVDNIAAEVDSSTRATAVRVVVPNAQQLLKKDMYVRVAIHSRREHTGMLVPVSAVLRDEDNRPFVYIQNTSGAYERRSITLGARVNDQWQVTAGLVPGDKVVSEGGLFLQFAQSQ